MNRLDYQVQAPGFVRQATRVLMKLLLSWLCLSVSDFCCFGMYRQEALQQPGQPEIQPNFPSVISSPPAIHLDHEVSASDALDGQNVTAHSSSDARRLHFFSVPSLSYILIFIDYVPPQPRIHLLCILSAIACDLQHFDAHSSLGWQTCFL